MYHGRFLAIPFDICRTAMRLIAKVVIPLAGKAFPVHMLTAPPAWLGLTTPLRDIWATNVSMLASLSPASRDPSLPLLTGAGAALAIAGPRILAHRSAAATDLLSGTPRLGATSRRQLYALANAGYDPDRARTIYRRLMHFKFDPAQTLQPLLANAALTHPLLPSQVRETWLAAVMNALPTSRRLRHLGHEVVSNCLLCGSGIDDIRHFLGACLTFQNARTHAWELCFPGQPPLSPSPDPFRRTLLLEPDIPAEERSLNQVLIFAAWRARRDLRNGRILEPLLVERLIISVARRLLSVVVNSPEKTPPDETAFKAKRARLKGRAQAQIEKFSTQSLRVYTDGSAIGNPGPCGAGAIVLAPPKYQAFFPSATSCPLGLGNSLMAEIWAIGMVLERVCAIKRDFGALPPKLIHFCSDCQPALGIIFGGHKAGRYATLALRARQLLRTVRQYATVVALWIPAHVGLLGNEMADAIAKAASKHSLPPFQLAPPWERSRYFRSLVVPSA